MRHFVSLADVSTSEFAGLLELSARVKAEPARYREGLATKTLAMIFQKPSTRTRVSFEAGTFQLGGHALYLSGRDLQLGRGETIEDTAQVLSRYVDGILARVFAQADVQALTAGTVPVINGLSNRLHPCQALADFLTLKEHKGRLDGLVLAYVGDGNNVAHSLIHAGALTGVTVRLATPENYQPDPDIVAAARQAGAHVEVLRDPEKAVADADAVYTDVWASMGQEGEHAARTSILQNYQVNEALFARAAPDAIFLHCLPAHRGEEVTDGVVDHSRSVVLDQAENRLHVQKALMLHLIAGMALPVAD
ncbi:MAG: ornithine carbamoyltransferase [Proteobacteria bacterium]|nr:ornithine carbamoyltransferase [Pseudomonadota bacterium]